RLHRYLGTALRGGDGALVRDLPRDGLALPALLGASGVAVFHAAMLVGRLGAAWTVNRLGNRRTLAGAGLLTATGMALALATREPLLVVLGFWWWGLPSPRWCR
ncbi:MAG: hypothetical protein M3P37_07385, partial [Actinomycetota bacterium]|nr:hypothetical protein [Actinomycetota bacterium]